MNFILLLYSSFCGYKLFPTELLRQWGTTFLTGMLQFSFVPSLSAASILFPCLIFCFVCYSLLYALCPIPWSFFYFLPHAPCLLCCSAFSFLPCLQLYCLALPWSVTCHTRRLLVPFVQQVGHPCFKALLGSVASIALLQCSHSCAGCCSIKGKAYLQIYVESLGIKAAKPVIQ